MQMAKIAASQIQYNFKSPGLAAERTGDRWERRAESPDDACIPVWQSNLPSPWTFYSDKNWSHSI